MSETTEKEEELKFLAGQLRRPSGEAAGKIAEKMNMVNEPLFDLTLETMQVEDKEQILEIGFGSGIFMERIFREANLVTVYGVEFSEAMLEEARRNNRFLIDLNRLKLSYGESSKLAYPNEFFNKIFCNMVIYFWDEPEKHLTEIHRTLKPGGRFYTGFRTKASMINFPFTKYNFQLYTQEEWMSILRENGFKVVDVKRKQDPKIDSQEIDFPVESVCVVAEKQ